MGRGNAHPSLWFVKFLSSALHFSTQSGVDILPPWRMSTAGRLILLPGRTRGGIDQTIKHGKGVRRRRQQRSNRAALGPRSAHPEVHSMGPASTHLHPSKPPREASSPGARSPCPPCMSGRRAAPGHGWSSLLRTMQLLPPSRSRSFCARAKDSVAKHPRPQLRSSHPA